MKSKKLVSAILAAASIVGGVVGAQAQDYDTLDSKVNNVIADLNKQNGKIEALENKVNGIDTTRQVEAEATARKDADQKLQTNINTEATARKDADTKLNAKIDSNAAKVQEQLDAQDNKNKAQDESIKANGAAIKANKDSIKANADAIKANKAEADEKNTYFNSRIENNTANIDKNKVAIENEVTARKDADTKLQTQIDTNKQQISQNQQNIGKNSSAIKTLQDNWKDSNRAFNAEQVQKIDSNEANIDLIHRRVDDQQKQIDKNGFKADAALKVAGNGVLYNHATNLTDGVNENTKKIDAETDAREDADTKLQKQIEKNGIKADTALKVIGNGAMQNGATNLTDGVNQNTRLVEAEAKARDDADKAEAAERKDADQKLQSNIEAEATARENAVNALNSRIGQVESDANKGIAKASALAALHPLDYDPDNKFDIAAAGGFYKGENAFALGAFYRPNRNVMLSMGTTLTGGDNAYNVGLTFKIGKSGKHTEAGLTTADLYAMIDAMQDKMDQQQKKIEELEAKQAK